MTEKRTKLSSQQRTIATLAASGLTNKEIAERLDVGARSIETQFRRMRDKLGTHTKQETIASAMKLITEKEDADSRRLAELANGMPILLLAFGSDYAVIATNQATDALLPIEKERPEDGRQLWKAITPGASERQRLRMLNPESTRDYYDHRAQMQTKEGDLRVISWFSSAHEYPIPGWYSWAVGVDVSESEQREVIGRLHALATDQGTPGVWLLDGGFKTLYANPAVADILETTLDELDTKNPLDFIPEEQKAAAYDFIKQGGGEARMKLKTALGNFVDVKKTLRFGEIAYGKPEGYAVLIERV